MRQIGHVAGDPSAPNFHRFSSPHGEHLLVIPHSRIFDLTRDGAVAFDQGLDGDAAAAIGAILDGLGEPEEGEVALENVVAPAPQALSLNVSSSCNLSCSYCYAARGSFDGVQPDPMSWDTARGAIDALLARADAAFPITIGFLGGEPFANRALIHRSIQYAAEQGQLKGLDVRFSVTTNGTLLRPDDIALIRANRLAVTISIDGGTFVQDRQRPGGARRSRGSFASLVRAAAPLLADPGRAQIAARATVTRHDFELQQRFEDILALGFAEVGFSPLRMDKGGGDALADSDWQTYLNALTNVARGELERARRGQSIRLSNFAIALKQIARGASSPYPCGAGGGYFSVAADGRWYACHRAIGSAKFEMGDNRGLDELRRSVFLEEHHVHAQTACRVCWARYLCSGSCHQEATARSDSSCGFVRGWLGFCLSAYCELTGPSQDAPSALCQETVA